MLVGCIEAVMVGQYVAGEGTGHQKSGCAVMNVWTDDTLRDQTVLVLGVWLYI
jgi:hypothetical protein